jgi:hypothetical protein
MDKEKEGASTQKAVRKNSSMLLNGCILAVVFSVALMVVAGQISSNGGDKKLAAAINGVDFSIPPQPLMATSGNPLATCKLLDCLRLLPDDLCASHVYPDAYNGARDSKGRASALNETTKENCIKEIITTVKMAAGVELTRAQVLNKEATENIKTQMNAPIR